MEVQEIVKRINGNIHTSGCNLKVVTVIWNVEVMNLQYNS